MDLPPGNRPRGFPGHSHQLLWKSVLTQVNASRICRKRKIHTSVYLHNILKISVLYMYFVVEFSIIITVTSQRGGV